MQGIPVQLHLLPRKFFNAEIVFGMGRFLTKIVKRKKPATSFICLSCSRQTWRNILVSNSPDYTRSEKKHFSFFVAPLSPSASLDLRHIVYLIAVDTNLQNRPWTLRKLGHIWTVNPYNRRLNVYSKSTLNIKYKLDIENVIILKQTVILLVLLHRLKIPLNCTKSFIE